MRTAAGPGQALRRTATAGELGRSALKPSTWLANQPPHLPAAALPVILFPAALPLQQVNGGDGLGRQEVGESTCRIFKCGAEALLRMGVRALRSGRSS